MTPPRLGSGVAFLLLAPVGGVLALVRLGRAAGAPRVRRDGCAARSAGGRRESGRARAARACRSATGIITARTLPHRTLLASDLRRLTDASGWRRAGRTVGTLVAAQLASVPCLALAG